MGVIIIAIFSSWGFWGLVSNRGRYCPAHSAFSTSLTTHSAHRTHHRSFSVYPTPPAIFSSSLILISSDHLQASTLVYYREN